MDGKHNRFEVLNSLNKLLQHKETAQKTELLKLFTSYIYMSNPDYKYNETYLTDMIPAFWLNIEKYTRKVSFRENLIGMLKKIEIKDEYKCKLSIQIDETWELEFNSLAEKLERKWYSKITENPKINAVDREKIYVKCQFNDQNMVFTDYMESENSNTLLDFTSNSVEAFLKRLEDNLKNG
ncbi:MAG: hypothetical protein LLG02_01545 [Pelosinus sp.]|nr:hypothetical protein [Pelosinus sp.]